MPTAALAFAAALAGCGGMPKSPVAEAPVVRSVPAGIPAGIPALPRAGSGRGGYYLDDGPSDIIPEGLHDVPDAEPRVEPYARGPNKPYTVFGQSYVPVTDSRPYKERGYGSWYGKKFHGKKTSSGEPYDMFKMTAAHPTLPIPSYARVTHLASGKQVIVRVNDRGPFRSSRIIDLSYTAALKLGYLGKGSGLLEVEHLLPEEIERLARQKRDSCVCSFGKKPSPRMYFGYIPLKKAILRDKMPGQVWDFHSRRQVRAYISLSITLKFEPLAIHAGYGPGPTTRTPS